jgi:hypothetical protein
MVGQHRAVTIATRYQLGDPSIKTQSGEIFRTHPDWPWEPPSLLYEYQVITWGKNSWGVALTTHPHQAPGLKKEYIYISTPPVMAGYRDANLFVCDGY